MGEQQSRNIMDYDTVRLDDENNAVVIIDQTKLPGKNRDHFASHGAGNLERDLSASGARSTGDRSGGGIWDLCAGKTDGYGGLRYILP